MENKSSLESITKRLKTLSDEFDKSQKKMAAEYKALLKEHFKTEIFDKHAEIKSFAWKQYASYYCDGGPCNFNVYYDDLTINDVDTTHGDFDDIPEGLDLKKYTEWYENIYDVVKKLNDDLLKTAFGGDSIVTAYRNGSIKSEEYGDHD